MIHYADSEHRGMVTVSTPTEGNPNPPQQNQPNPPPQNTPAPPPPPAAAPPQPPAAAAPQHGSGQDLIAAINALPERIVNGLREATQPPKNTTPPAPTGDGGGGSQTGTQGGSQGGSTGSGQGGTPQKKTFAQWWFGG